MAQETKYLRQPVYLGTGEGGEARARRAERLQEAAGVGFSELVRGLIDREAERRGTYDDPDTPTPSLPFGKW